MDARLILGGSIIVFASLCLGALQSGILTILQSFSLFLLLSGGTILIYSLYMFPRNRTESVGALAIGGVFSIIGSIIFLGVYWYLILLIIGLFLIFAGIRK